MALEELEKELYKKESDITERRRVRKPSISRRTEKAPQAPEAWGEGPSISSPRIGETEGVLGGTLEKTTRVGRPILWTAVAISLLIIGVGGFYIYQTLSSQGITLSVEAPDQILIGEPFRLSVIVRNDSNSVLGDASLALNLPSGTAIFGEAPGKVIERKDLGNVGIGGINRQDFNLIILDGENTVKNFDVSLFYSPTAISAAFEKKTRKNIAVGKPAISFNILSPNRVFSGENFEITLTYANDTEIDFEDLNIRVDFPPNFSFKTSNLRPAAGNNFWDLGDLRKNSEGRIIIQGNVIGPDQSFFDLSSTLSVSFAGRRYNIAEKEVRLSIAPSPLALSIFVNDSKDYIAKPGDFLNYSISYQNNTDVGLRDVILRLDLAGEMFDFSRISTTGFTSSLNRTVIWNAANVPDFRLLPPGARGRVRLSILLKPSYPIARLNDKNFLLKVKGQIESPTVPTLIGAEKTIGIASLETKVGGRMDIDAKAFFRDAASGILNAGPWPPKVDVPTQYTIHWEIRNFSTDVSDVEVRAFLMGGVRWTGSVQSNIDSVPEYNERTQEIIWKIPRIPATRGVISEPIKAIFQVEATPSLVYVGQYMPLLSETVIRGLDEFTQIEITDTDFDLSTDLPDDVTVGRGQGIVRQ